MIDKLGILIFSALYRVLFAKNNIGSVLRLLVATVKLIHGSLIRLVYLHFYTRLFFVSTLRADYFIQMV